MPLKIPSAKKSDAGKASEIEETIIEEEEKDATEYSEQSGEKSDIISPESEPEPEPEPEKKLTPLAEAGDALLEVHTILTHVKGGITAISTSHYELYHRLRKQLTKAQTTLDSIKEVHEKLR